MLGLNELIPTLLPPPARVLEVGCGEGALAEALAEAGYDVLAIDPEAPEGPIFRQVTLERLEEPAAFDVAVADRVLHHVHPLEPALDKLARLAPLVVVSEFAWERIDPPTQAWYEARRRRLIEEGRDPHGPADLDRWRWEHPGMHPAQVVLDALDERYERRALERGPYFHRWLKVPGIEAEEEAAIASGAIRPIAVRYVGSSRFAPRAASA